jgi:hypothetical protein
MKQEGTLLWGEGGKCVEYWYHRQWQQWCISRRYPRRLFEKVGPLHGRWWFASSEKTARKLAEEMLLLDGIDFES